MFKVQVTPDAVAESAGSKYINKSGIYDVTINFASVETSAKGAVAVNFNITHGDETKVFIRTIRSKY